MMYVIYLFNKVSVNLVIYLIYIHSCLITIWYLPYSYNYATGNLNYNSSSLCYFFLIATRGQDDHTLI